MTHHLLHQEIFQAENIHRRMLLETVISSEVSLNSDITQMTRT